MQGVQGQKKVHFLNINTERTAFILCDLFVSFRKHYATNGEGNFKCMINNLYLQNIQL